MKIAKGTFMIGRHNGRIQTNKERKLSFIFSYMDNSFVESGRISQRRVPWIRMSWERDQRGYAGLRRTFWWTESLFYKIYKGNNNDSFSLMSH